MKHLLTLRALLATTSLLSACDRAPAEPTPTAAAARSALPATPSPIAWTVPAGWTTEKTAIRGRYRAKYRVPPVGDDPPGAEALVQFLGKHPKANLDGTFARFRKSFEQQRPDVRAPEQLTLGTAKVRVIEWAGTYKLPIGPPIDRRGGHAAHVLKERWRGIGAGVETLAGEIFWFRLVGPDETVAASRSAMMAMLRSIR